VDGARQVKAVCPEAVLIFVLPPSREEQARRLRERGDSDDKVEQRTRKADEEEPIGRAIADHVVVNDDLAHTVDEMLSIIDHHRSLRGSEPRAPRRAPRGRGRRQPMLSKAVTGPRGGCRDNGRLR
jgi:guanylate kinase